MKKLVLGIVGLVIVLIAAVIVGPGLMNWNGYKVDIAKAVKDATGRDLKIDGDIELSLVPSITVSVGGIRLANAPGMKSKEMLSIKSVAAKIALFPLIGKRVVVDSFVISGLAVNLEVDAKGKQNWVFDGKPGAASPAAKSDPPGSTGGGLPISDLQLGDVRLVEGSISYLDAGSGQSVVVKNINLKVALQSLAGALSLTGDMNLNDKPVKLDARIDPVQNIISGERFAANFGITSEMATVSFDGKVLQSRYPASTAASAWMCRRWANWRRGWDGPWIPSSRTRARSKLRPNSPARAPR